MTRRWHGMLLVNAIHSSLYQNELRPGKSRMEAGLSTQPLSRSLLSLPSSNWYTRSITIFMSSYLSRHSYRIQTPSLRSYRDRHGHFTLWSSLDYYSCHGNVYSAVLGIVRDPSSNPQDRPEIRGKAARFSWNKFFHAHVEYASVVKKISVVVAESNTGGKEQL